MHNRTYFQLFLSFIFIIAAVYGVTYGTKWYSETYEQKYDDSNKVIDNQLAKANISDSNAITSYKEMHDNANAVNSLLMTLFFLGLIIFLIIWLIIMIRRAILQ